MATMSGHKAMATMSGHNHEWSQSHGNHEWSPKDTQWMLLDMVPTENKCNRNFHRLTKH